MAELFHSLRVSVRTLRRSPGLTAIAILALTLGIGLTTAMYSIVHGALRNLPFDDADRLLHLERNRPAEGIDSMEVTIADYLDWRSQQSSFEDLAAFTQGTANLASGDANPERYEGAFMTTNAFRLLRVHAALGRTFEDGEDGPGAPATVILGHRVWRDRFQSDPEIVGETVRINGEPSVILGVMPEGFRFPYDQDLWLPLRWDADLPSRDAGQTLEVYGRLAPGVTADQAQVEMSSIAQRLAAAYPETNEGVGAVVKPYTEEFVGEEAISLLYVMLGAVLGVLLIACANVANLLLARTALRSREVAVRSALGAGRLRVVLSVLGEAALLSGVGALLGLGLATVGLEMFDRAIRATDPPYWLTFGIDAQVAAVVIALTAAATLLSGLLPALQASGARVGEVLKDESRGASSFRLGRLARTLVVAEIALSCGLLVATGLMVKSVVELRTHDYGFPVDGLFTARIGLFESDYPTPDDRVRFFESLRERIAERPEAQAVALTDSLPVLGSPRTHFALRGEAPNEDALPRARQVTVSPGFFEAFELRPLAGRTFTAHDRRDSQPVALVNQLFAERYFPGEDPIGRQVRLGRAETEGESRPWRTIVGVVPDMALGGPRKEDPEGIYVPLAQSDVQFASLVVRTEGDPMALAPAVRQAVGSLDPYLPIYWVRTLTEAIHTQNWFVDVFGTIFGIFGVSGLLLAVIGLYGVMSFSVQRRTHEVGIRMALGADSGKILRLMVRQGAIQVGLGTVLGIGLALALSRGIQILLFGVQPWDPGIFVTIIAVLVVTSLAAAVLPARRAAVVDPAVALRRD